ncbi:hypothetical protein D3C72_1188520 [compost metagenome]
MGGGHVLGQVEVVHAEPRGHGGHVDGRMERQRIEHGVGPGQQGGAGAGLGRVAGAHGNLARQAVQPVRVMVDQTDAVVAGIREHRRDHTADLAGAEHDDRQRPGRLGQVPRGAGTKVGWLHDGSPSKMHESVREVWAALRTFCSCKIDESAP